MGGEETLVLWRVISSLGPEVGTPPDVLGCEREAPSWQGSRANGEVSRIREGSMFDQGPFLADLIVFTEGSGHSPSYTLCFLVGESWPQDQLWIKRLVILKAVPTRLRALLDTDLLHRPIRGCLLTGEHCPPAHFQQPPTLPSLHQYKAYLQNLVEE